MATGQLAEQAVSPPVASEPLEPDDLFHSLQNERRRRVLRVVTAAGDETLAMGAIAESIAAVENECPEHLVSSNQRKRVYIALYQNHLPQLDDMGLVEYDQGRGKVAAGPALAQAVAFLEMTAAADAQGESDDEVDDGAEAAGQAGRFDRSLLTGDRSSLGLAASGGVAAANLVATAAVWGGVLDATNALAVALAVAVVTFVIAAAGSFS